MASSSVASMSTLSHSHRTESRRDLRSSTTFPSMTYPRIYTILLVLMSFYTLSSAIIVDVDAVVNSSPDFLRLAERGEIMMAPPELIKRSASTSTSASSKATSTSSSSASTTSLPTPFDTSIGNFTTTSCPSFFNTFLSNSTFKSCVPISLMLQNSASFFTTSKSPLLLSVTLDAACGVDLSVCSSVMKSFATQLVQDSNCGQDYRYQNPYVVQAHAGLVAYEPIYHATCIKNTQTGNYCFADAFTNASNPSDTYPYYIALGITLPGGSKPTCSQCLQNTMAVYASAAADKNQPVSSTYIYAAQLIDVSCGPTFVNSTVPVAVITSRASQSTTSTTLILSLITLLGLVLAL